MVMLSLGSTASLLAHPSEAEAAFLFGLSGRRLITVAITMSPALAGIYLLSTFTKRGQPASTLHYIHRWLVKKRTGCKIILLTILASGAGCILLIATRAGSFQILAPPNPNSPDDAYYTFIAFENVQGYFKALEPVIILTTGAFTLTGIFITLLLMPSREKLNAHKTTFRHIILAMLVFGLYLAGWGLLGWDKLALHTDKSTFGWQSLGAPLLDTQVFLVFSLSLTLVLVTTWAKGHTHQWRMITLIEKNKTDMFLFFLIWLAAALYWTSTPAPDTWFTAAPRYPNFEVYPHSDSMLYDINAHNLITGMGFRKGNQPYGQRPVYTILLSILHTITGPNFEAVLSLQSAFLAILPALLYLLTRSLYNRLSGVTVALLITLQEANAIALMDRITVTNSRLALPEVPTTVGVVLFSLLLTRWYQSTDRPSWLLIIAGGVIGISMQIRIETLVLLPASIVLFTLTFLPMPSKIFKNTFWIVTGMLAFLAPWVARNYAKTGQIYLELPGNRTSYIAEWSKPSPSSQASLSFSKNLINHFAYNQIQGVLIFPDGYRFLDSVSAYMIHHNQPRFEKACCTRKDYVQRFPFWGWRTWDNILPQQSIIPITVNLLIISLGIALAFVRKGFLGLFPLILTEGHYLVTAAIRMSGGRFIHIVEWTWIVYYGLGLAWLANVMIISFFPLKHTLAPTHPASIQRPKSSKIHQHLSQQSILGSFLFILLLGCSLPITEMLIKPKYTPQTQQQLLNRMQNLLQKTSPGLSEFMSKSLQHSDGAVLQGRALYPRYYEAGEGEPGSLTILSPGETPFFYFYLVGPRNLDIRMVFNIRPNIDFPHASDVLVFGCQTPQGFVPLATFIDSSNQVLYDATQITGKSSCRDYGSTTP